MTDDLNDGSASWVRLGFEEAVLTDFAFLVRVDGFRLVRSDPSLVRFEGQAGVAVEVSLDQVSFELSADLVRLPPHPAERFSVLEIARLGGATGVGPTTWLQASTVGSIAAGVARLAAILRAHGTAALQGDVSVIAGLRSLQQAESERYLAEGKGAQARQALPDAWARRDYGLVVQILEGISDQLSPAERQRLGHARKKLAEGGGEG